MTNLFIEAHKLTREIAAKYEVNYQAQFGICLSYLLEKGEKEMIKVTIDKYFNNLDNVKLRLVTNRFIAFSEKTEEYKSLKKLDEDHFDEKEKEWISANRKYFIINKGYNEDDFGMMEAYTNYYFTKESIENIDKEAEEYKESDKHKEKLEKENERMNDFSKLNELAMTTNNDDFEDVTGLKRQDYLI